MLRLIIPSPDPVCCMLCVMFCTFHMSWNTQSASRHSFDESPTEMSHIDAGRKMVYRTSIVPQTDLSIWVLTVLYQGASEPTPGRRRCELAFSTVNTNESETDLQKHMVKSTFQYNFCILVESGINYCLWAAGCLLGASQVPPGCLLENPVKKP